MNTLACLTITVFFLSSLCQKSCSEETSTLTESSPQTSNSTESSPQTSTSTETSLQTSSSTKTSPSTPEHHFKTSDQCLHPEFCSEAARCCQLGVDEYGWIAAAVGWSLWFLTLIILCIDKLTKLKPDGPKYLEA